ncbi:hypothetical protein JHK85_040976 [Glycine max]|nr:hypothetical protein JHK86_040389 [Glycine max]KAG4966001.1 hypothetical protein JHK85_040976 [Glycine max]
MELIYLSLMTQRLKNTKNQLGRRRRSTTEFHSLNEGSVTGSLLSFEMTIVSQLEAMQHKGKRSSRKESKSPPMFWHNLLYTTFETTNWFIARNLDPICIKRPPTEVTRLGLHLQTFA